MTDKHTQGRLATSESTEHWGRTNAHINDADGNMLGSIWCGTTEQNKVNARRLVACWNLLQPFTTGQIEGWEADVLALAAQRDELLAHLKIMVNALADSDDEGLIEHTEPMIAAREAIAKAEASK